MNIYAGNLSYDITETEFKALFEEFGEVSDVRLISDRDTGRPKGFGFVTMPNDEEAQAAIRALHDKEIGGRNIRVNEARPRENSGPRPARW